MRVLEREFKEVGLNLEYELSEILNSNDVDDRDVVSISLSRYIVNERLLWTNELCQTDYIKITIFVREGD